MGEVVKYSLYTIMLNDRDDFAIRTNEESARYCS